jgi:hypothetical protein
VLEKAMIMSLDEVAFGNRLLANSAVAKATSSRGAFGMAAYKDQSMWCILGDFQVGSRLVVVDKVSSFASDSSRDAELRANRQAKRFGIIRYSHVHEYVVVLFGGRDVSL